MSENELGREIVLKKIEDVGKCRMTFSKRGNSILKMANDISVWCDVDVAFVAFSPSGRITKFRNKKSIEEVLLRYVNTPPGGRLNHVGNIQNKLEKMRHFDHIRGERQKLQVIDKQIENLQLQMKKCGLQLQISEAGLREYEIEEEQQHSWHQISWCERNINNSMDKIIAKQSELLLGNSNYAPSVNTGSLIPSNSRIPSNACNIPDDPNSPFVYVPRPMVALDSLTPPPQQPFVLDQTLRNFPLQNNLNGWNNSHHMMTFSNANHNPSQNFYLTQPSRFTATKMPTTDAPRYGDNTGSCLQFPNSMLSQFTNVEGGEMGHLDINHGSNYGGEEENGHQQDARYIAHPSMENDQDTGLDHNPQPEETPGDNTAWKSNMENNLWDWEDLLINENMNLGNISM